MNEKLFLMILHKFFSRYHKSSVTLSGTDKNQDSTGTKLYYFSLILYNSSWKHPFILSI